MRKLVWCTALSFAFGGCGDDAAKTPDAAVIPDAPVETLGPPPSLAMACSDSLADVYSFPSGLPTMDDSHRGDVIRCAPGESLSAYKVNAQIDAYNTGYTGTSPGKATSGFWTFRIAYRSERNTVNNARAEGDTAAFLLIPEKPVANAPLIVFGHGSTGFAAKCAPTHLDLAGPVQDQDYPTMMYKLAGAGYTVIAPDYNGFSYGQAPGYFVAEDEAHAVLDATRAAAKILPSPPAKVAFVGHSQGGHAVIAAHSYADAYGMTGELVGVATVAPFWMSLSLFAAATTDAATLSTQNQADIGSILYAMAYAYSENELREGAGHGVEVFATAKQTAAKDVLLNGECYDVPKMQALGTKPSEFFEPTYVQGAGQCAILGTSCSDAQSTKWSPRWIEERPPIDATGAPLLVITGGMDLLIKPGRARCGKDALDAAIAGGGSTTTIQYCYNETAGHRDIVRTANVDYLISWIANKAGVGPAPGACTPPDDSVTCSTVFPANI